jgi:hypothetical protein
MRRFVANGDGAAAMRTRREAAPIATCTLAAAVKLDRARWQPKSRPHILLAHLSKCL